MTINFEEEAEISLPLECEKEASFIIEGALDFLDCPYESEVNLLLTDNEGIHLINKEFRQIDKETDVLSFPMTQFPLPGEFDFLEEEYDSFNPETGELLLGDIVISKERVLAQAAEYGHSVRREYAFLITHSILHLCGYDHMEEEERLQMEEKQREILNSLQIFRE